MDKGKLNQANLLSKKLTSMHDDGLIFSANRQASYKLNAISLHAPAQPDERKNNVKVVFIPEGALGSKPQVQNGITYKIPPKTFDIIVQLLRGEFNEQHEALLKQWEEL